MPVADVKESAAPNLTDSQRREPSARGAKSTEGSTSATLNLSLAIIIMSTVAVFLLGYSVRRHHV